MFAIMSLIGLFAAGVCHFLCLLSPELVMREAVPYLFGFLFVLHAVACLRQFAFVNGTKEGAWANILSHTSNPSRNGWVLRRLCLYAGGLFGLTILSFMVAFLTAALGFQSLADGFFMTILTFFSLTFTAGLAVFFFANYLIHSAWGNRKAR